MKPERIQRKRTKGWRMPPNTVYVGRPSPLGNDWTIRDAAFRGIREPAAQRAWAVKAFQYDLDQCIDTPYSRYHRDRIAELRGKNLACWCPLDQPCHADVLLEIANRPGGSLDAEAKSEGLSRLRQNIPASHGASAVRPSGVQEVATATASYPRSAGSRTHASLRRLIAALQRIVDRTDCECEHDDDNCCARVDDAHCPGCIAADALKGGQL